MATLQPGDADAGTTEEQTESSSGDSPAQTETSEAQDEPQAAPAEADEESAGSSSPCSAPPEGASSLGLGTLALMATPLSLAGIPFLRRLGEKGLTKVMEPAPK